MPRITVGNKEIVVNFQHGTMPCRYQGNTSKEKSTTVRESDYTKCVILSGPLGCRDENKNVDGEATVVRFHTDPHNRKLARVNALNMALQSGDFSKQELTAIWNTIRK